MDFKKFYEAVNLIHEVEQSNLESLLQEFNTFSHQEIPAELAKEWRFTGLGNEWFFTGDFLQQKGFKNIFDVMREKAETKNQNFITGTRLPPQY